LLAQKKEAKKMAGKNKLTHFCLFPILRLFEIFLQSSAPRSKFKLRVITHCWRRLFFRQEQQNDFINSPAEKKALDLSLDLVVVSKNEVRAESSSALLRPY
jgi:hypothetical protein